MPGLSQLNRRLYGISNQIVQDNSNSGLLFGGTSEQEFNFLSGLVANSNAPTFAAFLAGVSATNLAVQQQEQQTFDNAVRLRTQNIDEAQAQSQIELRGAQEQGITIDNATLNQRNLADLGNTNARTGFTNQQARQVAITNTFLPEVTRANIGQTQARARLTGLQGDQLIIDNQTRGVANRAAIDATVANAQGQQIANQQQQARTPFIGALTQAELASVQAGTADTRVITQGRRIQNNIQQQTAPAQVQQQNNAAVGGQIANQQAFMQTLYTPQALAQELKLNAQKIREGAFDEQFRQARELQNQELIKSQITANSRPPRGAVQVPGNIRPMGAQVPQSVPAATPVTPQVGATPPPTANAAAPATDQFTRYAQVLIQGRNEGRISPEEFNYGISNLPYMAMPETLIGADLSVVGDPNEMTKIFTGIFNRAAGVAQ